MDQEKSRMTYWRILVLSVAVVLTLAAASAVVWFSSNPVSDSGGVPLFIYPGDTGARIAERVDSLHLFPSAWSFKFLCKATDLDKHLKVGRYDFTNEHSRWYIYRTLREGKSSFVKTTIPEGLTLERITQILAESTSVDLNEFSQLVDDSQFIHSLGIEAKSLEGYLFPQTYMIPWGSPPDYTVRTLTDHLMNFMEDSLGTRMREIRFSLHELLTFASLIEAEARDGEERCRISSVYHNRLRKGMLLQCDPTVIYALGGLDRPLFHKDLEIDSPYNTYKYTGLPPGPICSPGAASITAALYPEETNYLYFVANGKGGHIFSETLKQHNTARRKVKSESD
jgi:UPF0755 protein